jgi:SAM-dependent methyltransferase
VLDHTFAQERKKKRELQFRYKSRLMVVVQAARKYVGGANLRVLDFGAAEGLSLLEMNQLLPNSEFLGIEYTQSLIDAAPPLPPNIRIIRGDVTRLPAEVPENSFDVVSALAVLEHIADPVVAVKEAQRALRPGGIFVATCPQPTWDKISQKFGLLKGGHHEADLDRRAMIGLMEKSGLELLEYRRFMWTPIAFLPYLRLVPPVGLALAVDRFIGALRIYNWMFVNQAVIGRKPRR